MPEHCDLLLMTRNYALRADVNVVNQDAATESILADDRER